MGNAEFLFLQDVCIRENYAALLRETGYVVLQPFLGEESVRRLVEEIGVLVAEHSADSLHTIRRDKRGQVILGKRFEIAGDYLFDFTRDQRLLALGEDLLKKPVVPLNSEYFNLPAQSDNQSPAHQDHALYSHFPDQMAIAFWIALDPVEHSNGPLEFAQGYWSTLLPHRTSSNTYFDTELESTEGLNFTKVLVPAGACIAFHSFAVHRSGGNPTTRQRRAWVCNYRGSPYKAALKSHLSGAPPPQLSGKILPKPR